MNVNKRVVIADDESIIRLDLKEILEGDGYLVVGEAARGDDALAMIKEHEPDLALLDIKMPGIDGIEVARALKGSNTVIVLLTAFSQRTLIESARDAGVSAYLVKPFRSSEILPKLAAIIESRGERSRSPLTRPRARTTRSRRARSSNAPRNSSWPSADSTSRPPLR